MNQNSTHQELLSGIVDRFLFQNTEGFSIFVLQLANNNSVVVKGYVPSIHPGAQLALEGTWIMHPKFGRQFEASKCSAQLPSSIVGLKKYLASGLIKGIGKNYADKLVDRFGAQTLEIIDQYPERLQEVTGIGHKRLENIIAAWKDQKEISVVMVFLQDKGVSPAYATKIYKKYKQEAIALITENPYRLAEDIWGIGFKMADKVAQHVGFDTYSAKRIRAGIIFVITSSTQNGHLYLELTDLKSKTIELLEINETQAEHPMKIALHELYNAEKIKLIQQEEKHFITLSQYYFSEKNVAAKIVQLLITPSTLSLDFEAIYTTLRLQTNAAIALNEDQQHGIMTCLQHKVAIITGGPGTGKTTLIKQLLAILDTHKLIYRLAAPTGRAAKRMMEGTGRYAVTLHRLLEFDPATMNFVHNEQNALKLDFLIVDEASMIDIFLAQSLLRAVPLNAHILFIGDIDQLPSVGAGNFLNDLLASKKISSTRLTKIFRQAQDSLIILNAHKINNGEFPVSFLPDAKRDFIFIKETEPEKVQGFLQTIFKETLKKYGINPADAAVLVPMNRGIVGTYKLNQDLQGILNPEPHKKELIYAGTLFKVGDKVMQTRNNYDKNVFNGDVGYIDDIDLEDRMLSVIYYERVVAYEFEDLNELVLAYAISIHKSQGSEYAAVIIPIFMQHFMLLQRNLLYTGITRAKKLCIFIGEPKAIAMAVKNNKHVARKTFLQEFLTTDITCR
jgi:exodeoxyribonuclease V alpha subunit